MTVRSTVSFARRHICIDKPLNASLSLESALPVNLGSRPSPASIRFGALNPRRLEELVAPLLQYIVFLV